MPPTELLITSADIANAAERVRPHVVRTPLTVSVPMSERSGATVAIKAEHQQLTGSFKLRGALNKVMTLGAQEKAAGIVTASSGNHGIATATAAAIDGTRCTVYLPSIASPAKVAAIRRAGAEVIMVDNTDTYEAEKQARAAAVQGGATYVSPYNDLGVVAGQGTIGVEITEQGLETGLGPIDAVVVAVGGGGLISGVATWIRTHSPTTRIIGASPTNDQAMAASVAAGEIIAPPAHETFSDGTSGAVEPGSVTFDLCRTLVHDWMLIDEVDIAGGVANMVDDHHQLVEGSAGVALTAAEQYGAQHPGQTVVTITCGANVSSASLRVMLEAAQPG
ncbi:MAG: pyridoxal-phosphate dependent enzyme [Actinomycetia bacterium]|nr:pyridoxal-phosphate dependent enzyme [Actinomycetes bacterium]